MHTGFTFVLYLAFVYYLNTDLIHLFLTSRLLLSNYSKVYLWRQSASRGSTSINQELQGMSSKFWLHKLFLILNVCVVFKSDNDKLAYFFRLPSCKCDICCLGKVTLKSVKATNTKPRQAYDPCRVIRNRAKWAGGMFFSFISAFMRSRKRQQHLEPVTDFSQIAKSWSNLPYIVWVTLDLP